MNSEGCWGIVLLVLGVVAWVRDVPRMVVEFFKRLFKKDVQK